MRPVTAHGWNFGLYGVEVLARELKAARAAGGDIGALPTLQAFEREHRRTTLPVYLGTNALVSLFTDQRAPLFSGLIKSAITRQLTGETSGFTLPRPPWRRPRSAPAARLWNWRPYGPIELTIRSWQAW